MLIIKIYCLFLNIQLPYLKLGTIVVVLLYKYSLKKIDIDILKIKSIAFILHKSNKYMLTAVL